MECLCIGVMEKTLDLLSLNSSEYTFFNAGPWILLLGGSVVAIRGKLGMIMVLGIESYVSFDEWRRMFVLGNWNLDHTTVLIRVLSRG